jgi:feruloyl-CoA synthase
MKVGDRTAGGLFAAVDIEVLPDGEGGTLLRSRRQLGAYPQTLIEMLRRWATERPTQPYLAERGANGSWQHRSYAEVWQRTGELAAKIMAAGCSTERPLMILAPNGIAHAELALAAMRVGVPACPVSVAYASISKDYARLRHVAELATPGLLFVPDGEPYAAAARAIADLVGAQVTGTGWDRLPVVAPEAVARAESAVGADTIAKLLFTSGSTDKPKAVPNTHRMLCSNQAALATIWPGLASKPMVLVDWLPWNHTFGGNFTFNMALAHGGTYYVDAGKPVPALIGQTVANLKDCSPTVYFNVPAGYEALVPHLQSDPEFRRAFFSRLQFLFTAAAALPQSVQDRLQELARAQIGRELPMVAGWGSTETAPCCTAVHFPNSIAANIGVPLPGTDVRLVPDQDKLELRVRGPNVMRGYWRDAAASARAFDERGYYRMGDAGRLVDVRHPELGIVFDGRVSENFKLRSGTWVHVGALRLAVIEALRPLVTDAVIAGHDRDDVGVLLFPNIAACRALAAGGATDADLVIDAAVVARVGAGLLALNRAASGSAARVARFVLLDSAPQAEAHEITDKGYINQRAVLAARAASVLCLYGPEGYVVSAYS